MATRSATKKSAKPTTARSARGTVGKSKKPLTMEELLSQSKQQLIIPQKGETIKGTVTAKESKTLTVNIGAKTEAVVADKEYELAKEYLDQLKVGDEIEAVVVSSENDRGQVLLSLKQAAFDSIWKFFADALENKKELKAKGLETNKGGLIVLVNGTRGFVPSSQFGKQYMGKYESLIGEELLVKAIEVDRDKNRLIFSERHVSEESELAQRDQALQAVKPGEIYTGVVSGVMHFGLFITVEVPVASDKKDKKKDSKSVGHIEGLVHISEISWEKVSHPRDYNRVGDKVQVKVLGLDDKTGKLNLSIKQLSDDPWMSIDKNYSVGTTVTGKVSRIEPFGVFVNVEPGVDGLIHASKIDPDHQYRIDEEITVAVESVDSQKRRMSLSVVLTEVPVGYK